MSLGLTMGAVLPSILSTASAGFSGLAGFGSTLATLGGFLGGSALSTGGGLLSSALNYKYNKRLQDRAFAHQIKMYKHQHQWEVDDLREAGLNPILSANRGAVSSSAPTASVSAPNLDIDLLGDLVKFQGFSSARDAQRFNREMHEVDLATKEAVLARQSAEADYIRAQTHNLEVNTARQSFDLGFLSDSDYNELRKLDLLHKVFPIDGEIGFNVGKGKKGKGFGASLNLGDTYNAYGRSQFYKSMFQPESNSALKVYKKAPYPKPDTNYKYRYYRKNY